MNPDLPHYIVRLTGGTVLRMPAGRGPECVYDRLLKVLSECDVESWDYPEKWKPGTEAQVSAVAFRADERAAEGK